MRLTDRDIRYIDDVDFASPIQYEVWTLIEFATSHSEVNIFEILGMQTQRNVLTDLQMCDILM